LSYEVKGATEKGRNKMNRATMIQRLVKKGANPRAAVELLNQLCATHSPENLIVALRYHNFITAGQAEKMAA